MLRELAGKLLKAGMAVLEPKCYRENRESRYCFLVVILQSDVTCATNPVAYILTAKYSCSRFMAHKIALETT